MAEFGRREIDLPPSDAHPAPAVVDREIAQHERLWIGMLAQRRPDPGSGNHPRHMRSMTGGIFRLNRIGD
ncbi:MAG: hypothetical protein OXJ64_19930 [Boseongicola sp.]|nr:hypothetical protein [Boseongicola sp.]